MDRSNKPKAIDFLSAPLLAVIMFSVGGPFLFFFLAPLKLPFVFVVDSTHLFLFDRILVLPRNYPHLAYLAYTGLLSAAISSALALILNASWKRFAEYSKDLVDEHNTKENSDIGIHSESSLNTDHITSVNENPSEFTLKNETIQPLEPEVLRHDLDSL